MDGFHLRGVAYSPGYSDMRGAFHETVLRQSGAGEWRVRRRDREAYGAPETVAEHAVPAGAAAEFEAFLEREGVLSLSERPDSGEFATDYSPWEYRVEAERAGRGETRRICEFRRYSAADRRLLAELSRRFAALCGGGNAP